MAVIVWHRNDLRIEDNPALIAALKTKEPIISIYIYTPSEEKSLGGASKWWLGKSLKSLQQDYMKKGGKLILKRGDPSKVLKQIVQKTKATALYYNTRFDPEGIKEDKKIIRGLKIPVETFNGNHLVDPSFFKNKSGKPFLVYAPFWNALQKEYTERIPLKAPQKIKSFSFQVKQDKLPLASNKRWHKKLEKYWDPGRSGAIKNLSAFRKKGAQYEKNRDFPSIQGTSMLSPHLHFGEISPREVWAALKGTKSFLRQLGWREFGISFVYHFPKTPLKNWNQKFDRFPWKTSPALLKKWEKGMTGYPIIDAAMRQLWETGWMHNRLRMVVASFLVKDLFIHWKKGAAWFWDTLVDADLGNNTLGWQWVAGSGPDASPFFRIFNPILQGEKFDPEGKFVREFVPELKNLPKKWIHKPWLAPKEELEKAGVILGKTYPKPIVDHVKAREIALKEYKKLC